jgi:hypothetical protein
MDPELNVIGNCPCCDTTITAKMLMYHTDRVLPCPNCQRDLHFKLDYYPTEEEWYGSKDTQVPPPDEIDILPF